MDRKISVRCIIYCLLGIGGQSFISSDLEALVKGKFKVVALYHIAKFVSWPEKVFPGKKTPIVFTVLGQDPSGSSFEEELCGKLIQNREIAIRRVKTLDALNPDFCHLLFICKSEKNNLSEIIAQVRNRAIVTISDIDDFTASGGIVGITPRKVPRFEVNMEALSLSGLSMGSQLLSLARIKHEILPEQIFDIARHTIWPAPDSTKQDTTFKLMILGNMPFGKMMELISQNNTLKGKKVNVVQARYSKELTEADL
ncbi:MAG: YfiR/HmsC family protein, partial [bacterium]